MQKRVIVWRNDLLPYSETFIREQIFNYKSWKAVLAGLKRTGELDLANLDVRVFRSENPNLVERVQWSAYLRLNITPLQFIHGLRRERAQLVHAHFGLDGAMVWPAAKALGLPLLVTLHGYDITIGPEWWEAGNGGLIAKNYPARLLRMAHDPSVHFIAVSDAIKAQAIARGIAAEKLTTCYIGIDTAKFAPGPIPITERPRRILFVGRLVEKKGCIYLLQAMREVVRKIPDVDLHVVGDGPLRDELMRFAAEHALPARFLGKLTPAGVKQELDMSRVFCLPSVRAENGDAEGFGLVLLEAQSAGVPTVSSAHGGAKEGIVDGATGFRVEERDVPALTDRLIKLLSDDLAARQMGRAAERLVRERFDISACSKTLETQYDRVVQHATAPYFAVD